MSSTRKLAAIVFADIAGYTAMMQKNEHEALQVLNHFRRDIDSFVPRFNGEIVQYYGDGCLLIFNSAVEAIKCSEELQQSLNTDPSVPVRIGIHQGDVILEGGNIFGDNVNIAARIESMSIPGAILLSAKVRSELMNQPDIKLKSLGEYEFKNVEEPIEVFAYAAVGFPIPVKGEITGKFKTQNEEKSIAVLAFKNQSSDSEQEYFSEGISEEIIYGLSQLENLNVAGRMSSFSFKNSTVPLTEIAEQLKVEHILEGSVRKSGDRVRVNVQLVNVVDGFQIWTERFDRKLKDIFSIQDEIAEKVVLKLKLTLLGKEKSQALISRKTTDVQAYELYLRGRSYLDNRTNIEQALTCFNKAIEVDPDFAAAYSSIAYAYFYKVVFENIAPNDGFPKAAVAIQKALSIDDAIAEAHTMQGLVDFYFYHQVEKAREEYEKAVRLQPKYSDTYRVKAYFHVMIHEDERAIENAKKSYELDPLSFNNCFSLGDIYYRTKRYNEAFVLFEKLADQYPDKTHLKTMIAVLKFLLGKKHEAKMLLESLNPQGTSFDLYGNDRFVVLARIGHKDIVKNQLETILKKRSEIWISPLIIASLYFSLEEVEKGMEYVPLALKENDPMLAIIDSLPLWDDFIAIPEVEQFLIERQKSILKAKI